MKLESRLHRNPHHLSQILEIKKRSKSKKKKAERKTKHLNPHQPRLKNLRQLPKV